jgi:hypothetical protein
MASTISLSPKPGIKCFPANAIALEGFKKFIDKDRLWTGESTQCAGCHHHVEQHCTRDHCDRTINRHCHGTNELCNCKFFMAHSIRLSQSNCDKIVTERLAGDFEIPEITELKQ